MEHEFPKILGHLFLKSLGRWWFLEIHGAWFSKL